MQREQLRFMILDLENLKKLGTNSSGFTKALTDKLGVNRPLKKGWFKKLAKQNKVITKEEFNQLVLLSTVKSKQLKKIKTMQL